MAPFPFAARVAVVGAGPSGIFAVAALLRRDNLRVDVLDRSPTPFGLVRYGVAPDHLKIKQVSTRLTQIMSDPRVTYLGNVELGRQVTLDELRARYDAVVLATGAPRSRRLGVPGEDLPGHVPAGQLVDWYNGRPGAGAPSGLPARRVAVIGAGNVAIDAARVLLKAAGGLAHTDVTRPVLDELHRTQVREVTVLARRGVADTKFTPAELLALNQLPGVHIDVDPAETQLSEVDHQRARADRPTATRVALFQQWAAAASDRGANVASKVLRFRFGHSPVAILGQHQAEAVELAGPLGRWTLPVDAVVSAIGYRGEPVDGAPFDESSGRFPSDGGRIEPGLYVTGWARRGPSGVIGSNKSCAAETVATLLADLDGAARSAARAGAAPLLRARGAQVVDWRGWQAIDQAERTAGEASGRAREKIADRDQLVHIGHTNNPTTKESP